MSNNENKHSWDKKFLELAIHIGDWSKDRSRKVGCVIVGPDKEIRATGYNGFPRGLDDDVDERHTRPLKYAWTEHAERNAIYNAARCGVSTKGCAIYMPWYPCVDCAKAILQSGIGMAVLTKPNFNDSKYGESFKVTDEMFREASAKSLIYIQFVDLKDLGIDRDFNR